ncbi:MAG: Smr/MutS family protein, partial [Spirochaetaceae bacterium]|nr:Smr/MutS family protein [Spirochaetaceae bacterium]
KVVDAKVVDAKVVEVKVVEVKPVETKIVVDKEDNVESLTDKIELEKNSKEVATTKKRDESSKTDVTWNIDTKISTKYYNDDFEEIITEETEVESTKLNSSSKNSVQSNKYKNKESKTKRAPFVLNTPPTEDVPTKWNFSDIYQAWSNSNEEDKAIAEAKKMKTKKDNKGISISYLRSMSPQDELDLHGLVSDMAFIRTREFLERSRDNGLKKVSIITGKGLHSSDGIGILRDTALSAISLSGIVREAYHPKACDGGSGAIWVIFKSTTDKKVYF